MKDNGRAIFPNVDEDKFVHAVRRVVAAYVAGSREGDRDTLTEVFHRDAWIRGFLNGQSVDLHRSAFIDAVVASPPRQLKAHLAHVEVSGPAAVARVECVDWNGVDYTDFFTLIEQDSRWSIASKVFHAH